MVRLSRPTLDDLKTQLRASNLRATAPRIAVLRCLHEATTPVSHAELAEKLAPDGWDRATVYRNLTDLTDSGMARRSDHGDHVWRFELQNEAEAHSDGHPHFVCDECGDVSCLPEGSVEIRSQKGAPARLKERVATIQLKGRCERCV
ncbi:MAG: transcriptional repressor [Deltaproteobacteria bacterium]|nr:transcriptional repressor [Deltaproteobacteria bacterium]